MHNESTTPSSSTTPPALQMRHATSSPEDEIVVLEMMQAFYAEDKIQFVEERARRAIGQLTRQPEHGSVFLFTLPKSSACCGGGNANREVFAGYAVATLGFTLEHGGRFVLLDELYLRRFTRGLGYGQQALNLIKNWSKKLGVEALRLEVHHHNPRAKAIYTKSGFGNDHRDLLTLWL